MLIDNPTVRHSDAWYRLRTALANAHGPGKRKLATVMSPQFFVELMAGREDHLYQSVDAAGVAYIDGYPYRIDDTLPGSQVYVETQARDLFAEADKIITELVLAGDGLVEALDRGTAYKRALSRLRRALTRAKP